MDLKSLTDRTYRINWCAVNARLEFERGDKRKKKRKNKKTTRRIVILIVPPSPLPTTRVGKTIVNRSVKTLEDQRPGRAPLHRTILNREQYASRTIQYFY